MLLGYFCIQCDNVENTSIYYTIGEMENNCTYMLQFDEEIFIIKYVCKIYCIFSLFIRIQDFFYQHNCGRKNVNFPLLKKG